MNDIDKLIEESETILQKATQLCLIEIEKMARNILLKNKKLSEFIMAMGTYTFTRKDRNYLHDFEDSGFDSFMDKYSDLNLTGIPMRFTAKGDVVTDW
jgi:hypothetical protein